MTTETTFHEPEPALRRRRIPAGEARVAVFRRTYDAPIADVWDALLSDRPYRAALTLDEARAEIRHGAGVQFDPLLARMFLDQCRTSGAPATPPAAAAGD